MSLRVDWEDDDGPRPPRRRINGATWEYVGPYSLDVNGIVGSWRYAGGNEFLSIGFVMGCVKDDEDTRDFSERMRACKK